MDTVETVSPSDSAPAASPPSFVQTWKWLENVMATAGLSRKHILFTAAVASVLPSTLRAKPEDMERLKAAVPLAINALLTAKNDGVTKASDIVRVRDLCPLSVMILASQTAREQAMELAKAEAAAADQADEEAINGVLLNLYPIFDARILAGEDIAGVTKECLAAVMERTTARVSLQSLGEFLYTRFTNLAAGAKAAREEVAKPELVVDNTGGNAAADAPVNGEPVLKMVQPEAATDSDGEGAKPEPESKPDSEAPSDASV